MHSDCPFLIIVYRYQRSNVNDKLLSGKEKAIKEYLRVLKPSGRLLTHDVSYQDEDTAKLIDQLRHTMNINVAPLKIDNWQNLFLQNGF